MLTPLKDKSVLITGGSAGIGLGLARAFARAGARVAISGRSQNKLDAALARLHAEGLHASGHIADVGRTDDAARLIAAAAAAQGGLDVLCCNAGVFPFAPLDSMSAEEWDLVQNTNVRGNFLCVQAALPWLRQAEHGRVILTSSITGPVTGYAGWSHYGASKAAQLGFMRSAALELARDDITINAVMPGNVLTEGLHELAGDTLGEDYLGKMTAAVPLRRLGSVDDIANAALFFASKEAGFITGQTLIVDGGQVLPESLDALAG